MWLAAKAWETYTSPSQAPRDMVDMMMFFGKSNNVTSVSWDEVKATVNPYRCV